MNQTEAGVVAKSNEREAHSLLRIVHVGILVSLLWKIRFYVWTVGVHQQYQVVDSFFPAFFQSQSVLVTSFVTAVITSFLTLFTWPKRTMITFGGLNLLGLSILCLHQHAYNDVTFLTCAWTSVWCLWLSTRVGESFVTLHARAAWYSHVILSLIFFGAAVGKLTPGYWSGEVLFELYFKDRDFWTYNLIRSSMSADSLPVAAMWHSRMVIVSEFVCAFLWLMPQKAASVIAIVVLCGIALTNNVFLFSVVTCLIALSIVGLHDSKENREPISEAQ